MSMCTRLSCCDLLHFDVQPIRGVSISRYSGLSSFGRRLERHAERRAPELPPAFEIVGLAVDDESGETAAMHANLSGIHQDADSIPPRGAFHRFEDIPHVSSPQSHRASPACTLRCQFGCSVSVPGTLTGSVMPIRSSI